MYYLAFFVLYGSVGFIAALQLSRVLASSGCKHWLMAVEHALVLSVAVFRAWNMLNYYVLYEFIPLKWITIISGVPHLFTSWIFTFGQRHTLQRHEEATVVAPRMRGKR